MGVGGVKTTIQHVKQPKKWKLERWGKIECNNNKTHKTTIKIENLKNGESGVKQRKTHIKQQKNGSLKSGL